MLEIAGLLAAWAGVVVLFWRTARGRAPVAAPPEALSRVSIIVPARNEERNLGRLLDSLSRLDYPFTEIIVVDDHSTDRTAEIARGHGVRLVSAPPLPSGWNGKNWACHHGAAAATGDFLLFTDADTRHRPDGLARALAYFQSERADLISALPYHLAETRWERMLGSFHALLLVATSPGAPRPARLFAVGQYLLFSRASYDHLGGHAAIRRQYPDDLALANHCLDVGGRFSVYRRAPLFDVRMYHDFADFRQGWRRNFLAGLHRSHPLAVVEVVLAVFAFLGGGRLHTLAGAGAALGAAVCVLIRQGRWGQLSPWGVLLTPLSIGLYSWITVLAVKDRFTGNVLRWKDRNYTDWTVPKRARTEP